MDFPETTDEEFEQIFMHVLDQAAKDNTYKFAFARFLLEYIQNQTKKHVEFSTIAEIYLKYYSTPRSYYLTFFMSEIKYATVTGSSEFKLLFEAG